MTTDDMKMTEEMQEEFAAILDGFDNAITTIGEDLTTRAQAMRCALETEKDGEGFKVALGKTATMEVGKIAEAIMIGMDSAQAVSFTALLLRAEARQMDNVARYLEAKAIILLTEEQDAAIQENGKLGLVED